MLYSGVKRMDIKLSSSSQLRRNYSDSLRNLREHLSITTPAASYPIKDIPISSSIPLNKCRQKAMESSSPEDIFQSFLSHPSGCLFPTSNGNYLIHQPYVSFKRWPLRPYSLQLISRQTIQNRHAVLIVLRSRSLQLSVTTSQFVQLLFHLKIYIMFKPSDIYFQRHYLKCFKMESLTYHILLGTGYQSQTISEIQLIFSILGIANSLNL